MAKSILKSSIAILVGTALSATAATKVDIQSELRGDTILSAPVTKIETAVGGAVATDPKNAGSYVAQVLGAGRGDTDVIAPEVVATAIKSLGNEPRPEAVGRIVYSAVKVTPSSVLEIVSRSAEVAPAKECRIEIARAAIAAVPDPYIEVEYTAGYRHTRVAVNGRTAVDYKDYKEYKDVVPPQRMPLREAIAKAAGVEVPDDDLNLYAVMEPRFLSGVGGVGRSNFANEPLLKGVEASEKPKPPKVTEHPTPPPISR